jgi:hydroxyacylglutathione hydrolase
MRIVAVPCLQDNYAYLVICEATGKAAVVDPSEAAPIIAAIEREGVDLVAIWTTHHHWDHTGGNKELVAAIQDLEVIGHRSDDKRIPKWTRLVDEGDEVTLGEQVKARIIHNPGHTTGAISFYIESYPAVFTGDTLFIAGCGRMFEGTPPMMHEALSKLGALPEDTMVFCGHEYTTSNLRFAAAVEPNNADIAAALETQAARGDEPSVPGTIGVERKINPFLRSAESHVAEAARASSNPKDDSPAEIFGALRRWKDDFAG